MILSIHLPFFYRDNNLPPILSAITAATIIISLLLHELAHIATVKACGGQVKKLRIRLLGTTAWVKGLEKLDPWRQYATYLAGPAVNATIAAVAWGRPGFWQNVFIYNLVLCIFNLLPIFPLDGGRLVQLFLGNRIGILRANRLLLKSGLAIGTVLMGLGVVQAVLYPWNVTLLCAGVYVRRKNKQLPTQLYWEFIQAMKAKLRRNLRVIELNLPKNMPATKAVEYLRWNVYAHIKTANSLMISERELLAIVYPFMHLTHRPQDNENPLPKF